MRIRGPPFRDSETINQQHHPFWPYETLASIGTLRLSHGESQVVFLSVESPTMISLLFNQGLSCIDTRQSEESPLRSFVKSAEYMSITQVSAFCSAAQRWEEDGGSRRGFPRVDCRCYRGDARIFCRTGTLAPQNEAILWSDS